MNRIIKFRSWHDDYGMNYNVEHEFDNCGWNFGALIDDGNYIIEQYTGLKDKNDNEIYEGDIVKYTAKGITYTFNMVVQFYRGDFIGIRIPYNPISSHDRLSSYNNTALEIIGNIHNDKYILGRHNIANIL